MADNEARARQVFDDAEKKLKGSGGFFNKIFGGSDPNGAAVSLFVQAGNLFKTSQLWKNAGDSFLRAAEICAKESDSKHDCATHYAEAGNCFRKVDPMTAISCYTKTCEIYTDMGRFTMAAKNHIIIAELYEKDMPDLEKCIEHYQVAANYYNGEESKSQANKCLSNVAKYAAQLEQYSKAVKVFEEIAMWEADHPTLKFNAKNNFFKALLCYLCLSSLDAQHALNRYENECPTFADSRECKLIKDLISAVEEENDEQFTAFVTAYDKISRLDEWQTRILLKIKKAIAEDEDDLK